MRLGFDQFIETWSFIILWNWYFPMSLGKPVKTQLNRVWNIVPSIAQRTLLFSKSDKQSKYMKKNVYTPWHHIYILAYLWNFSLLALRMQENQQFRCFKNGWMRAFIGQENIHECIATFTFVFLFLHSSFLNFCLFYLIFNRFFESFITIP